MSADIVFVLGYFAVTAGIGAYLVKAQNSVAEFFVAKRELGVLLIIPLLFAEMIAGAGTVGNAADAFKYGISSVWINWGMSIGVFMTIIFATKFYRVAGVKMGVMSVPAAYEMRFDKKTRLVMMAILIVVYAILFALQPLAAAAIIAPMLGISKAIVAWIMGLLFIYLTVSGGMRGLAWMNVLHSFVMYLGLGIVAYVVVKASGGWGGMQAALPAKSFNFGQPNWLTVNGWWLGSALGMLCSSSLIGCIFGGKSLKAINQASWLAGFFVLIFALFPALIGMGGKVLLPDVARNGILYAAANSVGPGFGVLAAMGVLAAIMSTAPALLLVTVTTITRDFYKLVKQDVDDEQEMKFARITTIVLGIICTFIGLNVTSILSQVAGAFQIRAIAGLVIMVAMVWPRVDARAAFWSMLTGGIVAAGWHFAGNPYMTSLWPSLIVGVPVLVILTLMAKRPVSEGFKRFADAAKEAEAEGIL